MFTLPITNQNSVISSPNDEKYLSFIHYSVKICEFVRQFLSCPIFFFQTKCSYAI